VRALGNGLHFIGEVVAGRGGRKGFAVATIKVQGLFDNFAKLGVHCFLIVALTTALQQAWSTSHVALLFVRPFHDFCVLGAVFHYCYPKCCPFKSAKNSLQKSMIMVRTSSLRRIPTYCQRMATRLLGLAFVVLFFSLAAFAEEPTLSAASRDAKPNILFIAIDDLNDWTETLGGHRQTLTPNLERLASRGMTFTNAHCPAPLCNASRAALMTGLRPSTTGVYTNRQPFRRVRPDAITLTQHFMAHS